MSAIIVCPLHDVEAIARARRPSHILSLISPSAELTRFAQIAPHHLELRFNDIADARDGLIAPSQDLVRDILAFGQAAQSAGPLLIHCWAGVSRSPAAAFIIACQMIGPGLEQALAHSLRKRAPYATPNPLMIELADQFLDRSGSMTRAVNGIGRGHDTAWGSSFSLRV
jgi:predicted protein tyrosine phosphatase